MKILMTSDTFLPDIGGAEIHVKNLIENLLDLKNDIILITTQPYHSDFDNGKKIVRIQWSKSRIFKIVALIWKNSKNAEIIHSHYCHKLAFISGLVGKFRKIPVIITLHGMGILDQPCAPFIYKMAHSFYRYFSLQLCTHIISTSQDLANFAYKYVHRDKITIVLNGYDSKEFYFKRFVPEKLKKRYENKKILLSVRRLVPKNGIHYVIEAIPYLIEKIPNLLYIAIGDGRMREYIEERIKFLGISKYVELLGEIANDTVPDYLKLADTVVFPSTAESSSIACAEALAMGKAIVASRVGGLVELIGKNHERGMLINLIGWEESNYNAPLRLSQENYKALAEAVINSIFNKNIEKEKMLSQYALNNLSWSIIVKKTVDIYKKFL